jgi:Flp pilus assembly protein TadD
MAGKRDGGWQHALAALAINPNSAWAHFAKGDILLFDGHPAEARDALTTALRLDPRGPFASLFLSFLAMTYYLEGDYILAAETGERTVARYPDMPQPYRWLAASLGQLGEIHKARAALRKALEVSAEAFEEYVRRCPPWYRIEDYERVLEGLRKAGWSG